MEVIMVNVAVLGYGTVGSGCRGNQDKSGNS